MIGARVRFALRDFVGTGSERFMSADTAECGRDRGTGWDSLGADKADGKLPLFVQKIIEISNHLVTVVVRNDEVDVEVVCLHCSPKHIPKTPRHALQCHHVKAPRIPGYFAPSRREEKTTTSNTSIVAAKEHTHMRPSPRTCTNPASSTRLSLLLRRPNMRIMHLCRKLETRNRLLKMRLQRTNHYKHKCFRVAAE
jgi:hypothetical protein